MKLIRIGISGYRSVSGSISLAVDPRVTVLIGANDNGKTNLLSAIQCLNDDHPITQKDANWDLGSEELPEIQWTFLLDNSERSTLLGLAKDAVASGGASAEIAVNLTSFEIMVAEISGDASSPVTVRTEQRYSIPNHVTFMRRGIESPVRIAGDADPTLALPVVQNALSVLRPRVELFRNVDQLIDVITLSELDSPSQEFMQGIFRYAGLWEQRAQLFTQNPASTRALMRGSDVFTKKVREEWQQGEQLHFQLNHAGQNGSHIELLIQDPAVSNRFVRPSERSEGFSAFFKMSMRLLARTAAYAANSYIFLFDEPGTSLHPSGQVNLQRVFERLASDDQIVYTTHSLFMVNHNRPERNRVVAKDSGGTKLDQKPYLRNWRAVRSSLGLILAGTFFIADRTLLVEGESDALYIGAVLGALDRAGCIDVDLNLFSVQWAGNSRDYEPMARLLMDEGREVVCLVDGDKGGKDLRKGIDRLNSNIASGNSTLTRTAELLELPNGQSIEDLLPNLDEYFDAVIAASEELVNNGYRKAAEEALDRDAKLAQLKTRPEGRTLGKHVEQTTKLWFAEREPISKLMIGRNYCAWLEDAPLSKETTVPDSITKLVEKLRLEAKASEASVFGTEKAQAAGA